METRPLICSANQLTGVCMIPILAFNELMNNENLEVFWHLLAFCGCIGPTYYLNVTHLNDFVIRLCKFCSHYQHYIVYFRNEKIYGLEKYKYLSKFRTQSNINDGVFLQKQLIAKNLISIQVFWALDHIFTINFFWRTIFIHF